MKNLISLLVVAFVSIAPAFAVDKQEIINALINERNVVEISATMNFTIGNLLTDEDVQAFHKSDPKMGDSLYNISMSQINLLMTIDAEITRLGGNYKFKGVDDCIRILQEDSLNLINNFERTNGN